MSFEVAGIWGFRVWGFQNFRELGLRALGLYGLRIQAFKQAVLRPSGEPAALESRLQLWRAVVTAKGFRPSFREWWSQRPVHSPADPHSFPLQPPTREIAELLFTALQRNVEFMEAKLRSTQRRYAKARRYENPSLLFRDLKGERPEPVESLVEGPQAVVEEVLGADGAAVLEGETSWMPGVPFMHAP